MHQKGGEEVNNGEETQTNGTPEDIAVDLPGEISRSQPAARCWDGRRRRQARASARPRREASQEEFFRVRPGEQWKREFGILAVPDENGVGDVLYLVSGELAQEYEEELKFVTLRLYVYKSEHAGLWPLRKPNGPSDEWARTAIAAARIAEAEWTRLIPGHGGYEAARPVNPISLEPKSPKKSFSELIKIGFEDRINSPNMTIRCCGTCEAADRALGAHRFRVSCTTGRAT